MTISGTNTNESPGLTSCVGYSFHPRIVMGQQIVTTFGVTSH
jgi:hypothetical protein